MEYILHCVARVELYLLFLEEEKLGAFLCFSNRQTDSPFGEKWKRTPEEICNAKEDPDHSSAIMP